MSLKRLLLSSQQSTVPFFVGAGTVAIGSSATVNVPLAGVSTAGDLLVMIVAKQLIASVDDYLASGWTKVSNTEFSTEFSSAMFVKVDNGSEPSTVAVTATNSIETAAFSGVMYRYRNYASYSGASNLGVLVSATTQEEANVVVAANELKCYFTLFLVETPDPTVSNTFIWNSITSTPTGGFNEVRIEASANNGTYTWGWIIDPPVNYNNTTYALSIFS